jgi:hypothetical protein
VFGLDIIAMKSVSLVCLTAAIPLTFLLFRNALGAGVAAGAAFRTHIDYIVLVPPTHPLASRYPAELGCDGWGSNPKCT